MGFPGDIVAPSDRPEAEPAARPGSSLATDVAPVPPAFRWIPIRSLATRHRGRIKDHLLGLGEQDRYLRFGYPASDAQIALYVDRIDFDQDEVYGVFNRRLDLIAMAHLAFLPPNAVQAQAAQRGSSEFGVSVSAHARGRGYGARLFDHAVLHARNRGVDTMIIHALSENTAMLKIARKAGASIERDGGDSEARLKLPPENLGSIVNALVEDQVAEFDYQLKQSVHRMDSLLGLFVEVRDHISATRAKRIE